MSGELKAMVEWTPPDPTKEERPRRRERRKPTTRKGVLIHGLRRLGLLLGGVTAALAVAAWLVASRSGRPFGAVLPLACYFAAAGVGVLAILSGGGLGSSRYSLGYGSEVRVRREQALSMSFFFGFLAAFLFGLGLALDYLL
jgi:hypothetical protein